MIRLIASIILLGFSLQINGQQRVTRVQQSSPDFDGFRSKISTIENQDSLLTQYVLFARGIVQSRPDSTLALANEIMELDQIDQFKRQAYKNYILSTYWYRPNPDSALKYAVKATGLFEQLGDKNLLVELMIQQARLHSLSNNYLLSEETYLEILEFWKVNKFESNEYNQERILNELTDLYIRVGAVELALERYNQLLELGPSTIINECAILLKVSNAYRRDRNLDEAKSRLLKCDNVESLDFGLRVAIMRSLSSLDSILGNNEEAVVRLEKVVELEEGNGRKNPMSYLVLAQAYEKNSEFQKADSLILILQGSNINRTSPPSRVNFHLLKTRSLIRQQLYNQALRSVDEAILIAEKIPPTPLLTDSYRLKADILELLEEYEEAYLIVSKIAETNDFVNERARISEEAMGKVSLQMRAKNDQLADVTSKLGTVKTRNVLIIFILILLALYIIYRYRVYYLLREERTRNRIARDLHDDLSGTLSSISFFSEAAKREHEDLNKSGKFLEKIDESAIEAKEKINDIIWAIDPENDDWTAFLTKCRRYAAEMFESKEISYDIDIDPNIDLPIEMKSRNDLWLIFKEIITNLVRHSKATEANVEMKLEKSKLILKIEDNGVGFDINKKQHGNGIFNVKKRIKSIAEGNNITLNSSSDEGTKWEIKFIL